LRAEAAGHASSTIVFTVANSREEEDVSERKGQEMDNSSRLLLYAAGIFVCYFYYGVLQERITKGKYLGATPGADPEPFNFSLSLVLTTCVVNYLFAKVFNLFSTPLRILHESHEFFVWILARFLNRSQK